jgi:hypothetical protein
VEQRKALPLVQATPDAIKFVTGGFQAFLTDVTAGAQALSLALPPLRLGEEQLRVFTARRDHFLPNPKGTDGRMIGSPLWSRMMVG